MRHDFQIICLLLLLFSLTPVQAQVHHGLFVNLDPQRHFLEVTDTISLSPVQKKAIQFALHPALDVKLLTQGARLEVVPEEQSLAVPELNIVAQHGAIKPRYYRVILPKGARQFRLHYQGSIHHPVQQLGEEYARSFSVTPGIIAQQGVFLSSHSFWYPQIQGELMTFTLSLTLPAKWSGMTQGERTRHDSKTRNEETWRCPTPQEEIYLIAGRFVEYKRSVAGIKTMVLLRQADKALAQKFLETTAQYLTLYQSLLGPYPYKKFAMVENFWETGYGMPSFTLLGSKVIRFPFILHSSYPHEILHNWWGNSVYVDYDKGNWAEGLTSYLADHLIKEQRGHGVAYRRGTLQRYTDYVKQQSDFPLTEFRGRHNAVTEAVGYGKTLMLFHMLRLQLGDEKFIKGLRRFYEKQRFLIADFGDIEQAFAQYSPKSLKRFFKQWVQRPGAPLLKIVRAKAERDGEVYRLRVRIEQIQQGKAFHIRVPVAVHLQGRERAYQTHIQMKRKHYELNLKLPARPVRIDVDPQFDVFRRLHRNEIPPALSQAFGAERVLIVLPSKAPKNLRSAYEKLAQSWQGSQAQTIEITYDNQLTFVPKDRALWLFGWRNHFRPLLKLALKDYAYTDTAQSLKIDETTLQASQHATVAVARHPDNPEHALAWLAADNAAALPGLGRKLPHYGAYSYLGFGGDAPSNLFKGQWPIVLSPMSRVVAHSDDVASADTAAKLAPRQALIAAPSAFSIESMRHHIDYLADPKMAGRGLGSKTLDQAADYIADQFRQMGLQAGGDSKGSYFQIWRQEIDTLGRKVTLKNVIAVLSGTDKKFAGQSVVIGAHYDHLGRGEIDAHAGDQGKVHPGADDNASGVAVLLELARSWSKKPPPPRTLIFVAFSAEEAQRLGSQYYVAHSNKRYPTRHIHAMLNLDTVGRLREQALSILGTGSAREWPHIFQGAAYVTGVAIKVVNDDFGSSDQSSFIAAGVPAVQFLGSLHADYHGPGDTADKIDYAGLVKVAKVAAEAVNYLAAREQPLHVQIDGFKQTAQSKNNARRRVTLGTIPDFAYQGKGVRLTGVRANTPAQTAGLKKDDIIIKLNEQDIDDLRAFSNALSQLKPGDKITLHYLRAGKRETLTTRVIQR